MVRIPGVLASAMENIPQQHGSPFGDSVYDETATVSLN
jgi:hypothetical protein